MQEAWRELIKNKNINETYSLQLHPGKDNKTLAGYYSCTGYELIEFENENPADALINLLIWINEEEVKHE